MMRSPPVLMYGLAWKAGPSWIASEALGRGPGSHPSMIPPEPLRLLKDWLRDCDWKWGLLLLLWSAKPDSGPQAGPTPSEDHVCSQKMTQGQGRAGQCA